MKKVTLLAIGLLVSYTTMQAQVWTQIGNDIEGAADDNNFGQSVSLSYDGTVLAVGAPKYDENGYNRGHVRIYVNQNGTWI